MAGDTKTTDQREVVPAPDYDDPFPGIQSTLDAIRDALVGRPSDAAGIFDLVAVASGVLTFAQHSYQRVQVAALVVSCGAAGTAIITIGSFARTFNVVAGVTVVPFPITLERGTDLTLTGTALTLAGYLIGSAE